MITKYIMKKSQLNNYNYLLFQEEKMKTKLFQLFAIIYFFAISNFVIAQPTHTIDFESGGVGADWTWIVAENGDNPPLEFISNPVSGGINTSAKVAKFVARQSGNPWALVFTDGDGQFTFNSTNAIVKIMVYKSVISPVHFKVEGSSPAVELTSANTVINQWQELTFDFSSAIGNTYNRIVIIPDFVARSQDNTIYIDNIQVPDGVLSSPTHNINFEPSGVGATWNWVVAENGDNPPLEFIANPVSGGINTSATVAKFIARQSGNPWALFFTDDNGTFTFNSNNSIVKIMVYKSVISPVHFKVEGGTGTPTELVGANTLVNQWEELTFDFSGVIGQTYNRIVIIPDFTARTQNNTIYIDNIRVPQGQVVVVPEPTVPAPTPTVPANNVISVFSEAYNNIPNTNFTPNWGQSTIVTFPRIQNNSVMKYSNLNYQGIELGSNQNLIAAGMQYLHIDFWTANSTNLGVYLISPGPVETRVALIPPGASQTWVSVDIPLSSFAPVDLSNVFQFKFDGNGTIYLDNIYFSTMLSDVRELNNSVPTDFTLEQNYPNPFNPSTNIRFSLPEASQVNLKVYNLLGQEVATLVDQFMNSGTFEISFDASNLPAGIYTYSLNAGNFQSVKKMMLVK
jgi:hypothetical protein